MRAFLLFLLFLALGVQLFLLARHYALPDEATQGPIAERPIKERGKKVKAEQKEPENPVRGIEIIRGMVVGEQGLPAKGVDIAITQTDVESFDAYRLPRRRDTWHLTSGDHGDFSVDTLAPGGYVVHAHARGLSAATFVTIKGRGGAGEATLTLRPSRNVPGSVKDSTGKPLKGAHVFVLGPRDGAPDLAAYRYLPATTEEDGSFLLEEIPQAAAAFLAVADDLTPALIREASEVRGGKPAPLRFSLGRGVRLAGYLTDADSGKPADKTAVVVTEQEFGLERVKKFTTGAASFLFENLRAGTYEFNVDSSRYALETRPTMIDVREGGPNLDLRLIRAGRLKGRIALEDERDGVAGVLVTAVSSADGSVHETTSGSTGYYSLEGLVPGAYEIRAEDPNGSLEVKGNPVINVEPGRLADGPDFIIVRGVDITGRVVGMDGRPVNGANVFVAFGTKRTPERSTRTATDGQFLQAGIPPQAKVRIWAERLGKASVVLGPEAVPAEGLHELTFTLSEDVSGLIIGQVVDAADQPVPGAVVECIPPDGVSDEPLSVRTGAAGEFRFEQLRAGLYRLQAGPASGEISTASSQQFTLESGQKLEGLRLRLP